MKYPAYFFFLGALKLKNNNNSNNNNQKKRQEVDQTERRLPRLSLQQRS